MNIKKERKKADDLYHKALSFFDDGKLQDAFQAAADSVLIYQVIYDITQQEEIFETFLIYVKNLLYTCVSVGLFQTKEGLKQIFQLIVKNFKDNWALLRLYHTAIEVYAKFLQGHYRYRTNNKIDPNIIEINEDQIKSLEINEKLIKSLEKLFVESSEAGVKLGELLIEDSEHGIKVLKMLQRYNVSLIPFCKNEQKKNKIVENINVVLNKLYDIKNPSSEVLNIIAITEINFALALYAIGKYQDAYEHYINGVNLSKKENLVEALERAEIVSKDKAVEKFLRNGAVGKFDSKEEEVEVKESNIIHDKGVDPKYRYLRRDPYKDQILREQSRQLTNDYSRDEVREYINNIALSINKEYNKLQKLVDIFNLKNNLQKIDNVLELRKFFEKRDKLIQEIFSFYWRESEYNRERVTELIIQFYSDYFEINPYEADYQFIPHILDSIENLKIRYKTASTGAGILKIANIKELKNLFLKFENLNINSKKLQYLEKISEEIKEFDIDVPAENLYRFLLDFSKVIPLKGSDHLTEDSNENEYKIKSYLGLLCFKIIEKDVNKKIIYEYDFSKSEIKEKGKLLLDFIDLTSVKVKLKIRNELKESLGNNEYLNWLGINLKSWIDQNIGKIVAKVVQTIIYEKTFENLTVGNYRILQAKLNAMGKNIDNLKSRFFEIKAPLTLTSFNCSECGASLNIQSKEETFIICEHCSTPFLMEWQKG